MKRIFALTVLLTLSCAVFAQDVIRPEGRGRIRDFGIEPGIFHPGTYNAITDVPGVRVGQVTLIEGDDIRTGVTAIVPHEGNLFRKKCPAAVYVGNGFGKLAGVTQIRELGNIETPIVLTNTLSVAQGIEGVLSYSLNVKAKNTTFAMT